MARFHTIKSILNGNRVDYETIKFTGFHTIKSILNIIPYKLNVFYFNRFSYY